ncbi:hypothetical protein WUBG_17892 [Wuchereria bancrofti]|uniref:Uncharacterized protein n=1 Tax=Wuchereria bancrofti TaxID=6293 RepID=J9DNW8_WUCBA|nr:hypothetical protein WUBG_17892 [Wuchereria bancrofti]
MQLMYERCFLWQYFRLYIFAHFRFLLLYAQEKLEKKRNKRRRRAKFGMKHQRKPFRNPRPITKADPHLLPAPAASRLTHHNVTTDIISSSMEQRNEKIKK